MAPSESNAPGDVNLTGFLPRPKAAQPAEAVEHKGQLRHPEVRASSARLEGWTAPLNQIGRPSFEARPAVQVHREARASGWRILQFDCFARRTFSF